MKWLKLACCETSGDLESFQKSVMVWINRPNVCNRIVSCSVVTHALPEYNSLHANLKESIEHASYLLRSYQKIANKEDFIKTGDYEFQYMLRKLVPKRPKVFQSSIELVVSHQHMYLFVPLNEEYILPGYIGVTYILHYFEELGKSATRVPKISAVYLDCMEPTSRSVCVQPLIACLKDCFVTKEWIQTVLLPKLCRWSSSENAQAVKQPFPNSHSLIDAEKYSLLYDTLKKKYGLKIAAVWPEVTDPQKYVYEDVAIAAYLLVLWEQERKELKLQSFQSFIDLGCGNGLLTYILSSEGHPGKGVDMRRRKIWDVYPETIDIQEVTVIPTSSELVDGYDWLLGNHSDELTPWIAVMAARNTCNSRYWVLPCCFFDLYGKYERKHPKRNQYEDYLEYIKVIGQICGFDMSTDVMRIPSTKRVCLVGSKPTTSQFDDAQILQAIEQLMQENKKNANLTAFQSRSKVAEVRNCTKVDRKTQSYIVKKVALYLLQSENRKQKTSGQWWNLGGSILLSEAASLFNQSTTNSLKRECGGLQTLLKNHHQVFQISHSRVQLRDWTVEEQPERRKRKTTNKTRDFSKTKLCWFYCNHPDGCPRSAEKCPFAHGENDIKDLQQQFDTVLSGRQHSQLTREQL